MITKRFYKKVSIEVSESGFGVLLDGRVLKTPGKQNLILPRKYQAELVAAEWRAQSENVLPDTMPCTRLINVASELTPSRRPELVKEFASYCNTDLLCFRSASPKDLAARQEKIWQPILDWSTKEYGIALTVTTHIKAPPQAESTLSAARDYATSLDNVDLTLLVHFTASFGSGVLALAMMEGYLSVETAYEASRLDEIFQNERWGEDDEAIERAQNIAKELAALAALIKE